MNILIATKLWQCTAQATLSPSHSRKATRNVVQMSVASGLYCLTSENSGYSNRIPSFRVSLLSQRYETEKSEANHRRVNISRQTGHEVYKATLRPIRVTTGAVVQQ